MMKSKENPAGLNADLKMLKAAARMAADNALATIEQNGGRKMAAQAAPGLAQMLSELETVCRDLADGWNACREAHREGKTQKRLTFRNLIMDIYQEAEREALRDFDLDVIRGGNFAVLRGEVSAEVAYAIRDAIGRILDEIEEEIG